MIIGEALMAQDLEEAGLFLGSLVIPASVYGLLALTKLGIRARFVDFNLRTKPLGTTTRRSTGQEAELFMFYPVVSITPDVSGTFTVEWDFVNTLDGYDFGRSIPTIVNEFSDLRGGETVSVELVDNRDPATTGRDPWAEGSLSIGDKYLAADGLWHSFKSVVTVRVVSPTGAYIDLSGVLGPEDFMCVGVLAADFQGFSLRTK